MRAVSVRVLLVVATLLLVGATATAYAWLVLFDSDRFVDRADRGARGRRRPHGDRRAGDRRPRPAPGARPARGPPARRLRRVGRDRRRRLRRPLPARRARRAPRRLPRRTATRSRSRSSTSGSSPRRPPGGSRRPRLRQLEDATGRVELLRRDIGSATGDVARYARGLRAVADRPARARRGPGRPAPSRWPATGARPSRRWARGWSPRASSSCAPSSSRARCRSTGSPTRWTARRPAASGTRSSATCARRASCWRSAARSSRPPRRLAHPPARPRGPDRGSVADRHAGAGPARAAARARRAARRRRRRW